MIKIIERFKAANFNPFRLLVGNYPFGDVRFLTRVEAEILSERMNAQLAGELSLIATRLGWTLQANGFLFAAFGFAENSLGTPSFKNSANLIDFRQNLRYFLTTTCIVGLVLALTTLLSVVGAYSAASIIKERWIIQFGHNSYLGRPFSDVFPSILGRLLPLILSITFVMTWAFFLSKELPMDSPLPLFVNWIEKSLGFPTIRTPDRPHQEVVRHKKFKR